LELGLVALSGTSLFAAVDQFRLRIASLPIPCVTGEDKAPESTGPSKTFHSSVAEPVTPVLAVAAMAGARNDGEETVPPRDETSGASAAAPPDATRRDPEITGAISAGRLPSFWPERVALSDVLLRTERRENCPVGEIRAVLADIASRFGPITVVATHQAKIVNHRLGSHREKLHHACRAIDFRPDPRRVSEIKTYLRGQAKIGGLESYRDGVIHIDLAERAAFAAGPPAYRAQITD
jgi:hypothetical protein